MAMRHKLLARVNTESGSLVIEPTATVRDVCDQLRVVLDAEGLIDEYFTTSPVDHLDKDHATRAWQAQVNGLPAPEPSPVRPAAVWNEIGYWGIAVYPVTGASEGIYVHVDIIGCKADWNKGDRGRYGLCFVKTWTWESAWKLTHRMVELLGA